MRDNYQHVKSSRTNLKYRMIYVMGDKCCICGYDKSRTALEFHHINPSEKDFTFSANTNRGWDFVVKELPKCILVCSNCHREIHEKITYSPQVTSFNEMRAYEVSQDIYKLKHKTIKTCPFCGTFINNSAKACGECSLLQRRKVERPVKSILKEEVRQYAFTTLATKYGVSDNAVRKWCISYGIPSRKIDIKKYSAEEWEQI